MHIVVVILKNCLAVSLLFGHYKYILLILKMDRMNFFMGSQKSPNLTVTVDFGNIRSMECITYQKFSNNSKGCFFSFLTNTLVQFFPLRCSGILFVQYV